MSFWSTEKLKQRLEEELLISRYDPDKIKHGSYELSLGPETFVTTEEKKQILEDNEQLVIPPGQFCLLLTEESIKIPADSIGFISIKASIKFRGLVNVSGFHVDPGFAGRLKFSVYNAGSQNIVLSRGQSVFLVWFSDLDQVTNDRYDGDHLNQNSITSEDVMRIQGKVVSPVVLDQRLSLLEHTVSSIKTLVFAIIAGLISGVILLLIKQYLDTRPASLPSAYTSSPLLNEEVRVKPPTQLDTSKPKGSEDIGNMKTEPSNVPRTQK